MLGAVQILNSIKVNAMSYVQSHVFTVLAHSKEYAMEDVYLDFQEINAKLIVQQIVLTDNVT